MPGRYARHQAKLRDQEERRWAQYKSQPPSSPPPSGDEERKVAPPRLPQGGEDSAFELEPDNLQTVRREFGLEIEVIDVEKEDDKYHGSITTGGFIAIMCILSVVVALVWFFIICVISLCIQTWGSKPAAGGFGAEILENVRDIFTTSAITVVLIIALISFQITIFEEPGLAKHRRRIMTGFTIMMLELIGVVWLMRWLVLWIFGP